MHWFRVTQFFLVKIDRWWIFNERGCGVWAIFQTRIHEKGFGPHNWGQVRLRLMIACLESLLVFGFQILGWQVYLRGCLTNLLFARTRNQNDIGSYWIIRLDKRRDFDGLFVFLMFGIKIWSSCRHRLGLPYLRSSQVNLFMTNALNWRINFLDINRWFGKIRHIKCSLSNFLILLWVLVRLFNKGWDQN